MTQRRSSMLAYEQDYPIRRSRKIRTRQSSPLRWLGPIVVLGGFGLGATLAWSLASQNATWAKDFFQNSLQQAFEYRPWLPTINHSRIQAKADLKEDLLKEAEALKTATKEVDPFALQPLAGLSYVPAIMYHDVVERRKQVWFDTTAAELRQHFELIRESGVTPISIDQLYRHLKEGDPLPPKAIHLTFDDAYLGQYENAYVLLKEFNYPATFFVQTGFVGVPTSKDHFTWDQMREMDQSGLVTFAPHTVNHPEDLRTLSPSALLKELTVAKERMEQELGKEMLYFAYPAGNRNEQVIAATAAAGYKMAFTMDSGFVGQSPNLLEVRRFNQFRVAEAVLGAQSLTSSSLPTYPLEVKTPLVVEEETVNRIATTLIRGGRPATVHAEARLNVKTLMERHKAPAGINGGFFSIPWIYSASNVMVGPVLSANTRAFIPGRPEDVQAVRGRPLVLIGKDRISFVPFDSGSMNTLEGIQRVLPDVTDAFVAGVWLVKNGEPLTESQLETFRLSSAAEFRPRAFFGVDREGRAVAGTTQNGTNSARLAQILPELGLQEAVLLDSGFSTSLIYKDQILATGHASASQPSRPVPHAILLYDMPELWAQGSRSPVGSQGASAEDKLRGIASLVPENQQADVFSTLQAVWQGEKVLEKGDRGSTIMALQMILTQIAATKSRFDLLVSGPDGVYGNEVSQALGALELNGLPPSPPAIARAQDLPVTYVGQLTKTPDPILTPDPSPPPATPIEFIDQKILGSILTAMQHSPTSVLVPETLVRAVEDLNQKPSRKVL